MFVHVLFYCGQVTQVISLNILVLA